MPLLKSNLSRVVPRVNLTIETSWDDGSIEDLKIVELLKKYEIRGTFYITVDFVGTPGHLTWEQIKEIDKHPLFEIGSHTITHPMDLKQLYDEQQEIEIKSSKEMLEAVVGHPVTKFCYPRGRYDQRAIERVIEAGYFEARTTKVGRITKGNPFTLDTTVHVYNERTEYEGMGWVEYGKRKLKSAKEDPTSSVFHLWGHGWEIEKNHEWENLENFLIHIKNNVQVR